MQEVIKKARFSRKRGAPPPDNSTFCSNQFEILSTHGNEEIKVSSNEPSVIAKKEKIPPIVVTVSDFKSFRAEISSFVSGVKVSFQIGRRGEVRIMTESRAGHKHLIQYLTEKMYKFYTYDSKYERPFKAVLKGLSNDQTDMEIRDTLTELLGFAPTQVTLMKKKQGNNNKRVGITQEIYLVHFDRTKVNNLKALEKAHVLFHVRVKWELYRKHGLNVGLTQCRNCQAWGHGTKHCRMLQKCLNCGDSSHTKDNCPVKEKPENFKCSNCNGQHKANFWQCPVREKILASRQRKQPKSNLNRQVLPVKPAGSISLPKPVDTKLNLGSTFASVVSGTSSTNSEKHFVFSASKPSNCDLGDISQDKFKFLNQSMLDLMAALLKTTSMYEAVQVGMQFTTNLILKLKFSNDFK